MPAAPRGKFISFEGLDGSGKSTQLGLCAEWLRGQGREVVTTREPGGTALGERLRSVLLQDGGPGMEPAAELALMFAARAQLVAEVIRPALGRGADVLCDRYVDASAAYQGGGRGLPLATIQGLHLALCGGLMPDLTLIYDQPLEVSLGRARRRASSGETRFEGENDAFFARVREAYRQLAEREPRRCRLIAATGTPEAVQALTRDAVRESWGHGLG